jgi:hypothetical protein
VLKINKVLVADASMSLSKNAQSPDSPTCSDLPVTLTGLQLPRVMTLNVAIGQALSVDQLRGDEELTPAGAGAAGSTPTSPTTATAAILPIAVIPDEC